jgi:hypothetical protein
MRNSSSHIDIRGRTVSQGSRVLLDCPITGWDMETECTLSNVANLQLSALVERIITFHVWLQFISLHSVLTWLWAARSKRRKSAWSKNSMKLRDNIWSFLYHCKRNLLFVPAEPHHPSSGYSTPMFMLSTIPPPLSIPKNGSGSLSP